MPSRILGGAVAAIALLLSACQARTQGQSSDSTAGHRIDPSRLALPAPANTPLMGYPAVTADKRVIQQMLRNRSFADLDRYFTGLQEQVRQRVQMEYEWVDANDAFLTADTTLGPLLDEWVAMAPQSAHARVARSTWYLQRAWYRRGNDYARETPAAAMRQMAVWAKQSAEEAMAALQIDSTNLLGYTDLINVLTFDGEKAQARRVFDRARKVYPGSVHLVHQFMYLMLPRWGGSFREMEALASEVAADSALNPRLAAVAGAVENEKSDIAASNEDFEESIAHANAALKYGPEFYSFLQRGESRIRSGDYDHGMEDINTVLSIRPQYPYALELRAYAIQVSAAYVTGEARVALLEQARTANELLQSFDPMNKRAREGLANVKIQLRTCPRDYRICGADSDLPGPAELQAMRKKAWTVLGIALLLSTWGFFKWIKSGFWIPRYIHLLAAFALSMVCFIDFVWVRAGQSMTLARWLVIPIFPLTVYFLFIGLGGAMMAPRNKMGRSP